MRLLLIVEPPDYDYTRYAILEDPPEDILRILRASHGKRVGGECWPEEMEFGELIEEGIPTIQLGVNAPSWVGPFDEVIITGFI